MTKEKKKIMFMKLGTTALEVFNEKSRKKLSMPANDAAFAL